jgi:hypothetical protein
MGGADFDSYGVGYEKFASRAETIFLAPDRDEQRGSLQGFSRK